MFIFSLEGSYTVYLFSFLKTFASAVVATAGLKVLKNAVLEIKKKAIGI